MGVAATLPVVGRGVRLGPGRAQGRGRSPDQTHRSTTRAARARAAACGRAAHAAASSHRVATRSLQKIPHAPGRGASSSVRAAKRSDGVVPTLRLRRSAAQTQISNHKSVRDRVGLRAPEAGPTACLAVRLLRRGGAEGRRTTRRPGVRLVVAHGTSATGSTHNAKAGCGTGRTDAAHISSVRRAAAASSCGRRRKSASTASTIRSASPGPPWPAARRCATQGNARELGEMPQGFGEISTSLSGSMSPALLETRRARRREHQPTSGAT